MVPAEQVHCHVKEEEDDLEVDHEGDAKTGYYFCKNGPVSGYHLTEEEREEISSVRIPAQPTNPVFVQVMHPGHVRGKKSGVVASDLPSENHYYELLSATSIFADTEHCHTFTEMKKKIIVQISLGNQ